MDSFFEALSIQYEKKLPFVSYRKPNENIVKNVLQSDAHVHYVNDYDESGFVFAPFDFEKKAVLIPFENCFEFVFNEKRYSESKEDLFKTNDGKEIHVELVEKAIKAINETSFSKVVLSRKEQFLAKETPITLFKKALSLYTNAFVYLWYHPKVGCWIGATPEVLLETRNNQFKTMSLAGTKLYKDNLNWQDKEQEEQQIVTDYIVKNLAENEFQFTSGTPYTIRAGDLAHIRTDINGTLNKSSNKNNLKRLIETLHPTPAVCGFPKKESRAFILKNEVYNREFYTGFLGEINLESRRKKNKRNTENMAYRFTTKSSSLFVNLRCMKLGGSDISIYVGGGITKNSNPLNEYEETCNKLNTMKKLL